MGLLQKQVAPSAAEVEGAAMPRRERRFKKLEQGRKVYETQLEATRELVESVSNTLGTIKKRDTSSRSKIIAKRLSLLSQQHTTLIELEGSIQKTMSETDRQNALLQEQDSVATIAKLVPEKAAYTFDDVQLVAQRMLEVQAQLCEEENQKTLTLEESAKRKQLLTLAETEYNGKKLEQEQFASVSASQREASNGLKITQQGEVVDLEERLAFYKYDLAGAKLRESEQKLQSIELHIERLKTQLVEYKKVFARVKKGARVTAEYVEGMDRALEQKRQQVTLERERINDNIRVIAEFKSKLQREIKDIQQRNDLSATDIAAIRSFSREPRSVSEWKAYVALLGLMLDESLYHIEGEYLSLQSELLKAQFRREEIGLLIVKSWHRMTTREARFRSDEEVEQEIKMYVAIKVELEGQIASLINARDAAISSLHQYNVSFEKLKSIAEELRRQQQGIFQYQSTDYANIVQLFTQTEEKVRRRFDWVTRLIEGYSTNISLLQSYAKQLESIMRELKAKSFWRRSEFSIDWSDARSFFPELRVFARDLRHATVQFFTQDHVASLLSTVRSFWDDPLRLILLMVNGILIFALYVLLRLYLPDVRAYVARIGHGYWLIHAISLALAAFLSFIYKHLTSIYCWTILFFLVRWQSLHDPYLAQLFYVATIPYGLWLIYSMINHWIDVNREKKYFFISQSYERRFFTIISFILSVFVIVVCIREAFILGGYPHSHVPSILSAILFILGQVAAIGLIGRAQILWLLRADTPLWQWIYDHVNKYYYFVWMIVIATIVMSNPYVGYGRQVLYVIIRVLLTVALIPILSWIHNSVKSVSLDLFFYYADRDMIKERFATGRFWYSMFVTLSLVLFLVAGIYTAAHLWGSGISLRDMAGWLKYPFYTVDEAGRDVPVTALSLLQVVFYMIGGLVIAYVINTFVLSRVLDPFIVESGIQNTVLTLMRYIIITIALFMGLTSAGLGGLTTKFAILLAGVGFAVQDAVRDFFAYFILLVQRPVKVGDFIRVLDGLSTEDPVSLTGFVRSITPRSIIIRKRNSTTVVIPNSRVVMNPVMNWSYTRGFFAFDDMRITVPYGSDPVVVKKLLLDVLDRNPNILKNPVPIVRLDDFVDNGYCFLVRGFLTSNKIGEQWDIASDIRLQVVKVLREHGIEVASPVRTLRIMDTEKSLPPRTGGNSSEGV